MEENDIESQNNYESVYLDSISYQDLLNEYENLSSLSE